MTLSPHYSPFFRSPVDNISLAVDHMRGVAALDNRYRADGTSYWAEVVHPGLAAVGDPLDVVSLRPGW